LIGPEPLFDHLIDSLHPIGLADDVAEPATSALAFDQRFVLVLHACFSRTIEIF